LDYVHCVDAAEFQRLKYTCIELSLLGLIGKFSQQQVDVYALGVFEMLPLPFSFGSLALIYTSTPC